MIRGGYITHCCVAPSFWNWEPSNLLLKEVLLAFVTTLLAYQVHNIGIDLLFGLKRRGIAKASDLGALLLAKESSMSAILSSLFPRTIFSRFRYQSLGSKCAGSSQNSPISISSSLKFILALLLGLIATHFSNFLIIEQDRTVSADQVQFGGIAGGINDDLSTTKVEFHNNMCTLFKSRYAHNEKPLLDFSICQDGVIDRLDREQNYVLMRIHRDNRENLFFNISGYGEQVLSMVYFVVTSEEKSYRLSQSLSKEQGLRLLDEGATALMKECNSNGTSEKEAVNYAVSAQESEWFVSRKIPCSTFSNLTGQSVVKTMTGKLTVVNSNIFKMGYIEQTGNIAASNDVFLASGQNLTYIRAEQLPLVKRSGGSVQIGTLLVALGTVLIARFALLFVANNDMDIGLETIFKDSVGAHCCDSVLQRVMPKSYDELCLNRDDRISRDNNYFGLN